jgi:hypothetical protein
MRPQRPYFEDGTLTERRSGTPQGGVVSPLLANIFLHFAFDTWMQRTFRQVPFERYADDILVHCWTKEQAEPVRQAVQERLARCKLEVHPEKTKIAYCQDSNRRATYPLHRFDFLGFTFRPRRSRNRQGEYFVSFSPADGGLVEAGPRRPMRRGWRRWSSAWRATASRCGRPSNPHRSLRISRVLRMDTRPAGIVPSSSPLWDMEGRTGGRPTPRGSGRARRVSARRVFGLARNHCSGSVGTGVRLPSESVFGFNRNARSASVGICKRPEGRYRGTRKVSVVLGSLAS